MLLKTGLFISAVTVPEPPPPYYPRLCMHASLFDPKERTKEVGYHRKQRRQVVMRLILERIIMRLITAPRPPQTTNVRHVVFVQYG